MCPACRYLLNVPGKESHQENVKEASNQNIRPAPRDKMKAQPIEARSMDQAAALTADLSKESKKASSKSSSATSSRSSGRRRVRHKKAGSQQVPEWEHSAPKTGNQQGNTALWIIGASLVGLAVLAIGAWLVIDTMKNDPGANQGSADQWVPDDSFTADHKIELTPEEKKTNQEIQDSIKTGVSVLAEAESVVQKFLSATTTEELRGLVRFPETSMPRIEAWYKSHPLEPTAFKQVGYGGRVTVKGTMASLSVQMSDYTLKQIALERTDEGYKVDWESWVSWTEMNWDDLFTKRPTKPKRVLVRCAIDTYYNRDFNDDTKWLAVKMVNPQSDRTLYGYIDRNDPSLMRFVSDLGAGSVAATLEIRYLENTKVGNQVIISKHVTNGWVAPSKSKADADDSKSE